MAIGVQQYRGSYLMPAFEKATVADVMRRGILSCPPDASLTAVAQMMASYHIHAVVIGGISTSHLVWGVISDMDVVHAAREGVQGRTAEDLVRGAPVTVGPSDSLDEAARLMEENRTSHLVVVENEYPVGVVSSLDIAGAVAWGRA